MSGPPASPPGSSPDSDAFAVEVCAPARCSPASHTRAGPATLSARFPVSQALCVRDTFSAEKSTRFGPSASQREPAGHPQPFVREARCLSSSQNPKLGWAWFRFPERLSAGQLPVRIRGPPGHAPKAARCCHAGCRRRPPTAGGWRVCGCGQLGCTDLTLNTRPGHAWGQIKKVHGVSHPDDLSASSSRAGEGLQDRHGRCSGKSP